MLVYTGIFSAPSLAIPSVGKEHSKVFVSFREQGQALTTLLKNSQPDVLLIVTPYGERYAEAVSIAVHDPYRASLHELGDYSEPLTFPIDLAGIGPLQEVWQKSPLRVTTSTQSYLDHVTASCLTLLQGFSMPTLPILVATPPVHAPKQLFSYGVALREWALCRSARVAILFTTFLSNRLSDISPGGMHPRALEFNQLLQKSLVDGNTIPLLRYADTEAEDLGGSDALDTFRFAAGVISEGRQKPYWHGEEMLFGIGHTAISFLPL